MTFRYKRRRKRRPRYRRKKRTFRYRRRRRVPKAKLRRMGRTSTDAVMVKLMWQENFSLLAAATPEPVASFRMNSLFDPALDATASQPVGFDQWALLYNRYQVYACKFQLIAVNNHLTNSFVVAVAPTAYLAPPATYTDLATTKYSTTRFLSIAGGGFPRVVINKYMSPRKIFGRRSYDTSWTSVVTTNPINQVFWHIRAQDTLLTHVVLNAYWQVRITYYVKFFQRKLVIEIPPP